MVTPIKVFYNIKDDKSSKKLEAQTQNNFSTIKNDLVVDKLMQLYSNECTESKLKILFFYRPKERKGRIIFISRCSLCFILCFRAK